MGRGLLVLAAALSACGADPLDSCVGFGRDTCLVVRARGLDPVDQLELTSLAGFSLSPNPGRSPPSAAEPFSLPALVPIDLGEFAGVFRLRVAGLRAGEVRSLGVVEERIARGQRKLVEVQLVRLESDGGPPDISVELPDLASDGGSLVECSVDCGVLPGVDPTRVRCAGARCELSGACAMGRGHCSTAWEDGCETDFTSAVTCGSCTNPCSGATPLCSLGSCVGSCTSPAPMQCGSGCVSFEAPDTCGGCDMRCSAPPGSIPSCDGGQCSFFCPAGSARTDGGCAEWDPQESGTSSPLLSIHGLSPTQVWIGGELGTLLDLRTNGTWRARSLLGAGDFYGVWISSQSEIFLAASDGKVHRSTDNLIFTPTDVTGGLGLWAIAGNNSGAGPWAVSFTRIFALNGNNWVMQFEDLKAALLATWAGPSKAFAVGTLEKNLNPVIYFFGVLYRGPGTWVGEQPHPRGLLGVWGTADGDFYVVGRIGTIMHFTGGRWVTEMQDGPDLHAIGGTGPDDVYAVGDDGAIFHSTGNGAWTRQTSGVDVKLRAVFGVREATGARHVWAVGEAGVILKKR